MQGTSQLFQLFLTILGLPEPSSQPVGQSQCLKVPTWQYRGYNVVISKGVVVYKYR